MHDKQQVPRADMIVTTANERFKGFLLDRDLCVHDTTGQICTMPYTAMRSVSFQRTGLFSVYDTLTITSTNGKKQSLRGVQGSVYFQTLDGRQQMHHLRNIRLIKVGRTTPMWLAFLI